MHYIYNGLIFFLNTYVWFIPFSFLVILGDEVTKIQKYYVIFVYILQDKMGKMEIKENYSTKVTKIPKTKRQKFGMNETKVRRFCNLS